jgi:hypothetical protein
MNLPPKFLAEIFGVVALERGPTLAKLADTLFCGA